jgi:hypothetical protein
MNQSSAWTVEVPWNVDLYSVSGFCALEGRVFWCAEVRCRAHYLYLDIDLPVASTG